MLNELLKDHRTGQDSMQLGSFVLGGRTKWGTYKQALRELYKRIRGLRQLITDKELLLVDIDEKSDVSRETLDNEYTKRREQIKLLQLQGSLEELDRSITDTKREAALFYRVASKLKEDLGEITEEKRSELDIEEWKWWHIKKAALSKLTSGRIGEVVLKNLMSIPINERQDWLSIIKNDGELIKLLENSEHGRIEMSAPSRDEIKYIENEINESGKYLGAS